MVGTKATGPVQPGRAEESAGMDSRTCMTGRGIRERGMALSWQAGRPILTVRGGWVDQRWVLAGCGAVALRRAALRTGEAAHRGCQHPDALPGLLQDCRGTSPDQ